MAAVLGRATVLVFLVTSSDGARPRHKQDATGRLASGRAAPQQAVSATAPFVELEGLLPVSPSALLEERQLPTLPPIALVCEQFPSLNCDFTPVFKGRGTFGQVWLAKDKRGSDVVVKVLYERGCVSYGSRWKTERFLTRADWDKHDDVKESVAEAVRECELAKVLNKGYKNMPENGPRRFMRCIGHNLPGGAPPPGDGDAAVLQPESQAGTPAPVPGRSGLWRSDDDDDSEEDKEEDDGEPVPVAKGLRRTASAVGQGRLKRPRDRTSRGVSMRPQGDGKQKRGSADFSRAGAEGHPTRSQARLNSTLGEGGDGKSDQGGQQGDHAKWLADQWEAIAGGDAAGEDDWLRPLGDELDTEAPLLPPASAGAAGAGKVYDEKDAPLHLILEYVGEETLEHFQFSTLNTTWSLNDVEVIAKEILEGLEYLQKFPPPHRMSKRRRSVPGRGKPCIVFHDLKPQNLVIKGGRSANEVPEVKFIDYGGMVRYTGDEDEACEWTGATPQYLPWEFGRAQLNKKTCKNEDGIFNFDPRYPQKFDVFAFGAIFIQLLTGIGWWDMVEEFGQILLKGPEKEEKAWVPTLSGILFPNHVFIWRVFSHKKFMRSLIKTYTDNAEGEVHPRTAELVKEFAGKKHAKSFLKKVLKCFAVKPRDRPSADALLKHSYMKGIKTHAAAKKM